MAKKLKRYFRKDLKQPDEFVSISVQVLEWLNERKWWLVGGAGGFVLIGLVTWGISSWMQGTQATATTALRDAFEILAADVTPDKKEDEPPKDPDKKTYATYEEKLAAARDALQKVQKEHEGSAAANVATLVLAQTRERLGEREQAKADLEAFLKNTAPSDELRQLAVEGMGYLHEEQGELDPAIAEFTKLSEGNPAFMGDYGYFHAARLYEKAGKKDQAVEQYDKLVKAFPESDLKSKAEARLTELRGPAPAEKPAEAPKAPEAPPAP